MTGPELAAALHALHAESVRYWSTFNTPTFFAPFGADWSPGDNVRHLTKAMRAVTVGLKMPRWLLWLLSGRSRASRGYEEMREVYLARLARGASAGRFTPSPNRVASDEERQRIMAFHAAAVDELTAALSRWPERALDTTKMPHPLLGPITVREMMFFTLYHNRHHVDGVRRRLTS